MKNIDQYDGNNDKKRQWLERNRPINWIAEWRKSYNMSEAVGGNKSVRLRRVNRNLVIPEQVG